MRGRKGNQKKMSTKFSTLIITTRIFFFPKNISYFNEYNVFETTKENINKWKWEENTDSEEMN